MKHDNHIEINKIKGYIYIDEFVKYHKKRIKILKHLLNKYRDKKLINSIVILGLESLAKLKYPKEKSSKTRFIKLLSKVISKKEAYRFYVFYRCPYIHVGMPDPFLDYEDDDNKSLMGMSEKDTDVSIVGSVDYPPKTLISVYEGLIYYIEDFFNKKGNFHRTLEFDVYRIPKEEKRMEKERKKRLKKFKSVNNLKGLRVG